MKVGQRLRGHVIADDRNDVARQLVRAVPVQQVRQTMAIGGNQDGYFRTVVRQRQVVIDMESFRQGLKVVAEVSDRNVEPLQVPFQPG